MTSHEPPLPADFLLLQPVRTAATAAGALVGLTCVLSAVDTWADWHAYQVVEDYVAGTPGVGVSDLVGADNVRFGAGLPYLLAYLAAGIVFLVWLWRARRNAENLRRTGTGSAAAGRSAAGSPRWSASGSRSGSSRTSGTPAARTA